jgi:hypothetical protein
MALGAYRLPMRKFADQVRKHQLLAVYGKAFSNGAYAT